MDLILGGVVGLLIGIALSLFFRKGDNTPAVKKLKAEHEKYRKQVDDHFVDTAFLFKGLTDQYRDVYQHIATGVTDLCSEEAKALQVEMQETALLAKPENVAESEKPDVTADVNVRASKDESAQPEKPVEPEGGIPLASEVELSKDLAEEIKNRAKGKS